MKQDKKYNKKKYEEFIKEGLDFVKDLKHDKAEISFKKAIELNQSKYEAYLNLANIYMIKSETKKSVDLLLSSLKNNININIVNHLGKICIQYNLYEDLKKLFNLLNLDTFKKKKDYYFIYFLSGLYYEKELEFVKAIDSFKNSISCNKYFFDSYPKILNNLESINDLINLKKYIDNGFINFKNQEYKNILVLFDCIYLNRIKEYKNSQRKIENNKLNEKFANNIDYQILLLDLQSKNSEKLKEYGIAFNKVTLRNTKTKNLKSNLGYSENVMFDIIEKYKNFYNKGMLNSINKRLRYKDDSNLIFLIGFPRSGTTLLDTILRTHSNIKVLEEKPYLLNLRHQFFEKYNNKISALKNIKQDEKDHIRNTYFQKIKLHKYEEENIIIDKLPLSMIEIGFIKCIFPNSRIILALRHPCDVVVSCFFSSFKINDAMVNFLSWENTIKFYNNVNELFEFYENEFDLKYHKIKYEDVVFDFKTQITSLLNYLELNYEKGLEEFYLTAKKRNKISTPSYNQVINPLYTSSIGRWKNYIEIKNPENELKKWINKFNY